MNRIFALLCFGLAFSVSMPAIASEQQEKMKGCNSEAKESGIKGDERKAFMSKCLKKDYKLKVQSEGKEGESGSSKEGEDKST